MTRQFLDLLIGQLGLGQHFSGLFSNSTITTSHGRPSSSILSSACSWEPSRQSISEGDTPDRKTQAPLRQRILRRLHHLLNLHARELQLHQGRKSHELIHLHGNQPDTWHGYGHGRILPDQDTHRITVSIARFIGHFHRPFLSAISIGRTRKLCFLRLSGVISSREDPARGVWPTAHSEALSLRRGTLALR